MGKSSCPLFPISQTFIQGISVYRKGIWFYFYFLPLRCEQAFLNVFCKILVMQNIKSYVVSLYLGKRIQPMMDTHLNMVISCSISQNCQGYCDYPRTGYASLPQILCSQNLLERHFMVLLFCEPYLENFLCWNRVLGNLQCQEQWLECFLYVPINFRVFTLLVSWNQFPNGFRMLLSEELMDSGCP